MNKLSENHYEREWIPSSSINPVNALDTELFKERFLGSVFVRRLLKSWFPPSGQQKNVENLFTERENASCLSQTKK